MISFDYCMKKCSNEKPIEVWMNIIREGTIKYELVRFCEQHLLEYIKGDDENFIIVEIRLQKRAKNKINQIC